MNEAELERYRSETPGCRTKVHLNNAGAGLMPTPVSDAIYEHIRLESEIGGYEAQHERRDEIASSYQSVADLLGTHPDNIAFTENATASFSQALSSIQFNPDDVILTTRNDYASNQIQFLAMQKRLGVRVIRAPDGDSGGVDVEAMGGLVEKHGPALVCVTHVPTNSGLQQDVDSIGAICRDNGTIYLVDACQSVGQMPVNVAAMQCDFLSATARKFLRGPRGSGFLFVSDRLLEQGLEPVFIDMHGASWTDENNYRPIATAKRFENWEFAWALVQATGVAAQYAIDIGLDKIQRRVLELVKKLRNDLACVNGVQVLGDSTELAGIVTATIASRDPADVVHALREQNINTSSQGREYAVLDYDDKQVDGALRISPHYYNSEDEIECLVDAVGRL